LVAGQIEANPLIFAPQQAYEVSTFGDPIEILLIDDCDGSGFLDSGIS